MTIRIFLRIIVLIAIILGIIFIPYYISVIIAMFNSNFSQYSIIESWAAGVCCIIVGGMFGILLSTVVMLIYNMLMDLLIKDFINWLLDKPKNKSNNITIKSK